MKRVKSNVNYRHKYLAKPNSPDSNGIDWKGSLLWGGESFDYNKNTITVQPLQATLPLFVRKATSNLEVKN